MDTLLDSSWRIAAVLLLVLVNGFFVAAEFALVSSRRTRIDQLASEGSARAKQVQRAMDDPNRFISAAQVGITVASLLLGAIGEPTLAHIMEPLLATFLPENAALVSSHGVAFVLALAMITYLHIVLGEQVPKMLALQRAEGTVLFTAPLTEALALAARPLIAALYWGTEFFLRLLRLEWQGEHSLVYSEDELKRVVEASTASGELEAHEQDLIRRAFAFDRAPVARAMIPRTEVIAVTTVIPLPDLLRTASEAGYTRYPVYEGDLDNIVGVVNIKTIVGLLADLMDGIEPDDFDVMAHSKPPLFVPETTHADDVLTQMGENHTQMAIVVDEYGGTAGIVTREGLLDNLVGGVSEDPEDLQPDVVVISPDEALVNGLLPLSDFQERFQTEVDANGYNTVGGLVFGLLGSAAEVGSTTHLDGYVATVEEMDGLRIAKVRLKRGYLEAEPAS